MRGRWGFRDGFEVGREALDHPSENTDMATAQITLSASRDIPFNKLVLSQSNVRRVKAGVSLASLPKTLSGARFCRA